MDCKDVETKGRKKPNISPNVMYVIVKLFSEKEVGNGVCNLRVG